MLLGKGACSGVFDFAGISSVWIKKSSSHAPAPAINIYTEYGFSSPEELETAVSAAFAEMYASADKLKPIELALKEKKELRRQIAKRGRPRLTKGSK